MQPPHSPFQLTDDKLHHSAVFAPFEMKAWRSLIVPPNAFSRTTTPSHLAMTWSPHRGIIRIIEAIPYAQYIHRVRSVHKDFRA